jgi:hypothetical protein
MTSEPSLLRKVAFLIGFSVALGATIWSASSTSEFPNLLSRLGFVCSQICILGLLTFFWSAICAYWVRKWDWTPWYCFIMAGLPFLVAGLLLWFFANTDRLRLFGNFISGNWLLVGYVCRSLAFPHLTDKQAAAPPPPLTLFPK